MKPSDFTAWRKRLGLTKAGAARALGVGINQPTLWERGDAPIPRAIALACAAIAYGLPPIGAKEEPDATRR